MTQYFLIIVYSLAWFVVSKPDATPQSAETFILGFEMQYNESYYEQIDIQNQLDNDLAALNAVKATIPGLQTAFDNAQTAATNAQNQLDATQASISQTEAQLVADGKIVGSTSRQLQAASVQLQLAQAAQARAQQNLDQFISNNNAILANTETAAFEIINTLTCTPQNQQADCNDDMGLGILHYWSLHCRIPSGFVCSSNTGGRCQCPTASTVRGGSSVGSLSPRDSVLWTASTLRSIDMNIRAELAALTQALADANTALTNAQAAFTTAQSNYNNAVAQYQSDINTLSSLMRQLSDDQVALFSAEITLGDATRALQIAQATAAQLQSIYDTELPILTKKKARLARENALLVDNAVNQMRTVDCTSPSDCTDGGGPMDFFAAIGCGTPAFVCNSVTEACDCTATVKYLRKH